MRSCTPAYKNGTYSSFNFDDVYIEILMTCKEVFWFHDNCADESYSGTWDNNYSFSSKTYPYLVSCDFNNSSMVFRAHIGGKSILFMGDTCHASGIGLAKCHDRYLKDGTRFNLKSDIVQVAHHGIGKFPKDVYTRIDPDVCLWPTYAKAYDGPAETKHSAYHTRQWLKKSVNILSYQGPQVLSFGADRLLFDFKTDTTSISRYHNSVYGMHNFASTSYWNKGPDMAKASISGGKLLLTTAATSTGKPNEYIETTTAKTSGRTHPLLFTPSANNVVIVAYQVTKYDQSTNYSKWGNGQKPTISLYAFDNGTETYENASQVTVDTSGKYVVQKWTLPQAWLQYKISNLHLKIRYFLNSSISIDYIYIGPETHAYQETVTAPGCTVEGSIAYNCTFCGHSYKEILPPTGHKEVINASVAPTCTENGLTEGKHCSVCKAVLVKQDTIAALGHSYRYTDKGDRHEAKCSQCDHCFTEDHSYTGNACICGAAEILEPITVETILINHSLNLANDISMNYVVRSDLLSGYDSFCLKVQVPVYNGNDLTGHQTVTIDPILNGSYYYFTMTEITAVNMNDILLATLHMSKGKQEYVSKPDHYSIATYALNQLNKEGITQELKVLCADLLRYGAAAQAFKSYRTDALVTASMTAAHKTFLSDLNAVAFGNTNTIHNDLVNPQITWVGKTLNLGSKVVVKFIFHAGAYGGNVSDLTLRITYQDNNGAYRTVTLSNPTAYNEANRQYAFEYDGLMAAELRTPLSVAVYSGDGQQSQTLQYSADTYGNNKTGTLGELCRALFAYSDSAKEYFS